MFVYALTEPIDVFDGLTPLPEWITADPVPRTRWALQALFALADTATQVRWTGDMRHLPSVGATLTPPGTSAYLVLKQDNNGSTFVVADSELSLPADFVELRAEVDQRRIGAWTHPTLADIATATIGHQRTDATPPIPAHYDDDPAF